MNLICLSVYIVYRIIYAGLFLLYDQAFVYDINQWTQYGGANGYRQADLWSLFINVLGLFGIRISMERQSQPTIQTNPFEVINLPNLATGFP